MKEENPAIAWSTSCRRGGVFSSRTKGASWAKNSFLIGRRLRKTGLVEKIVLATPLHGSRKAENHPDSP
jgi:hypothetical protein